jgi:hypothetical protein
MRNYMAAGWFYSPSQIGRYLLTRFSSLKPRRGEGNRHPIAVLRQLDRHQWLMFLAGFMGWTWDAFGTTPPSCFEVNKLTVISRLLHSLAVRHRDRN